ncbi:unnamed protein product [Arabidopsis halleri]
MGGLAMEEMPLLALFEQARKFHLAASESSVDQDVVKKGCEMFQKCEDMIGKLALFSSNETKEDISTNNLKYLLVPYYLAELTEKIIQDDRIPIVKASYAKLKEFTGYLVGYASFRALFNRNPALSAAGGILGLVLAMLVETLLFIINQIQSSKSFTPSFTPTTKKNQ